MIINYTIPILIVVMNRQLLVSKYKNGVFLFEYVNAFWRNQSYR